MLHCHRLGDSTRPITRASGVALALNGDTVAHRRLLVDLHLCLHELGGCHVL